MLSIVGYSAHTKIIIETLPPGGVFAFRRYHKGIREMHCISTPCHIVEVHKFSRF